MLIREAPTLNYIIDLHTYLLTGVLYFHKCDKSFTEVMLEDFATIYCMESVGIFFIVSICMTFAYVT